MSTVGKTPSNDLLTYVILDFRERKREREREDLWRKLETLSLTNARREGISLDYVNHVANVSSGSNSSVE